MVHWNMFECRAWYINSNITGNFCWGLRFLSFFLFCKIPYILGFSDMSPSRVLITVFFSLISCSLGTKCRILVDSYWISPACLLVECDRWFHLSHKCLVAFCDTVSMHLKRVTFHVCHAHDSFSLIGLGES